MVNIKRISFGFAFFGIVALVFAALSSGKQAEAAVASFDVDAVGAQENPPVVSTGSAFARFTFDDATRVLTYSVTVSGLSADQVTASHIHRGAIGVNGPIVYFLSDKGFTVVSGSLTLTPDDVNDLRNGNFYYNVHSIQYPGGFARGQLYLTADQAIKVSLDRTAAAWNAKNVNGFLSGWTDDGIASGFDGATRAEAAKELPDFIGSPPIVIKSVRVTSLADNHASVRGEATFGAQLNLIDWELVRSMQDGGWKIDSEEYLDTPIPSNVTTVNVDLKEYSFVYDKSLASKGNVAFKIQNVGKQPHEFVLAKIPANLNLADTIKNSDPEAGPPPGVEDVAQDFFMPGEDGTIVFTGPLAAGRYALVCFVPDNGSGPPHAVLGMYSDFTVAGGSGSGITPPSTGDAGLLDSSATRFAPGAAMLALSLFGFAFVAIQRRRA